MASPPGSRLLPIAPVGARVVWCLTAIGAVAYLIASLAGHGETPLVSSWLLVTVLTGAAISCAWRGLAQPEDRLPWLLLAAGILAWAGAEAVYELVVSHMRPEPYPSVADALWLVEYPTVFAALALMLRRRVGRMPRAFLLDALIGAVSASAIATTLIARLPILEGTHAAVLVNAAYPVGDALLLVLLAGAFTLSGWTLSPSWLLLAAAFGLQIVADTGYLVGVAHSSYVAGGLLDAGWFLAPLAIATAAWQRVPRNAGAHARGWSSLVTSAGCGGTCIALLLVDHFERLATAAVLIAGAGVSLVVARLMVVFRDRLRLAEAARHDSVTDALTGLGNRRSLLEALELAATDPGVLVLYDLDGFKGYNDTFGHLGGDDLLQRVGVRLERVASAVGARAFRLGGDEFCLLATGDPGRAAAISEQGRLALVEVGDGFAVGASAGFSVLPVTGGATTALAEADRRMYAAKQAGRARAMSAGDPQVPGWAARLQW